MPDLTHGHAPPLYWQQFEDLTVGVARVVFGDPTPQKAGRQGQDQKGIDVLVQSEDGRTVGIQCKQRDERDPDNLIERGASITLGDLTAAINKAEDHPASLDLFIFATTAKADRTIQNEAAAISKARKAVGDFEVMIWSWADYDAALNRDARLQAEYYRIVPQGLTPEERDQQLLDLIAEAFNRPAFRDPLSCEHADNFKRALADTQRLLATGELLDREGRRVRRGVGGVRTISDAGIRRRIEALAAALDEFRLLLVQAEQNGDVSQQGDWLMIPDQGVQKSLEGKRQRVVEILNGALFEAGLRPSPPPLLHRLPGSRGP